MARINPQIIDKGEYMIYKYTTIQEDKLLGGQSETRHTNTIYKVGKYFVHCTFSGTPFAVYDSYDDMASKLL